MYARRSKMDPLWMSLLVGGFENGQPCVFAFQCLYGERIPIEEHSILGCVDLQGTTYTSPTMATGYGAHLALPLMRKATESLDGGRLPTLQEAEELIERCMKVLFYRDARSINKVRLRSVSSLE